MSNRARQDVEEMGRKIQENYKLFYLSKKQYQPYSLRTLEWFAFKQFILIIYLNMIIIKTTIENKNTMKPVLWKW